MGRAGAGSTLLQAMLEGAAVRQLLHQCQREVQAATGVRVLAMKLPRLVLGGLASLSLLMIAETAAKQLLLPEEWPSASLTP
jgi:hypothetical protein